MKNQTCDIINKSLEQKELNKIFINTPQIYINKLKELKGECIEEKEIELGYCLSYAFFLIHQLPDNVKKKASLHFIPGLHGFIEIDNKCYDSFGMYGVDIDEVEEFLEKYFECDIDEFDEYIILNLEQFISDVKNI